MIPPQVITVIVNSLGKVLGRYAVAGTMQLPSATGGFRDTYIHRADRLKTTYEPLPTVTPAVEQVLQHLRDKPPPTPPPPVGPNTGTAFISYQHRDKEYVTRLVEFLAGHQISVWSDSQLAIGENWGDRIAEQIETAAAVIFVMSGRRPTENVQNEILLAQQLQKSCMPISLQGANWFEFLHIQHEAVSDGNRMPGRKFVEQLYEACVKPSPAYPPAARTTIPREDYSDPLSTTWRHA